MQSAGDLMTGLPGFRPCTPYGCMKLIESTGVPIKGKHAVVIGRSNTVGKPMALLLLQANATVTICHSATADIGAHTRQADIVVVATGRRNTLRGDMVKPGAIVIDVGMNRDDEGKLCGDVDFARVAPMAVVHHAGAGRRRADDDHHAADEHDRIGAERAERPVKPVRRPSQCPQHPRTSEPLANRSSPEPRRITSLP